MRAQGGKQRIATWVLLTALTAIALVATYNDPSGDADLWWHLKYGEQVVSDLTWNQDHGKWSWTPPDPDWRYVSWLSDAVMYVMYKGMGLPGIVLLQAILYVSVVAMYLRLVRLRRAVGVVDLVWIVVVFVAIKTTAIHWKPEMFTVVFFAAATAVYTQARMTGRERFWILPLLYLTWVNMHGGVLIGYLLLAALVTGETIARVSGSGLDQRAYRRLLMFSAAAVAVTGLNPEGPLMVVDWIQNLTSPHRGEETSAIVALGSRWGSLVPGSIDRSMKTAGAWAILTIFVWQAVTAVHRLRSGRGWDPSLMVGAVGFFLISMGIGRGALYAPLFFLMTSPIHALPHACRTSEHGRRTWATRDRWAGLALGGLTALAVFLHWTSYTALEWLGRSSERTYPIRASRFVREHDLPGPLFNDYLSGGYLVWDLAPERRVFFDPRLRPYSQEFRNEYFALNANTTVIGVEAYAQRYGFRTAVVDHRVAGPIARGFQQSKNWKLVYVGPVAAVFVRKDSLGPSIDEKFEQPVDLEQLAKTGDPIVLGSVGNLLLPSQPSLIVDLLRATRENVPAWNVRRPRLENALSERFSRLGWTVSDGRRLTAEEMRGRFAGLYLRGDLQSARVVAAAYVERHPRDATMLFNLACIESRLGHVEAAAACLDRALETGLEDERMVWDDEDLRPLRISEYFEGLRRRHGLIREEVAR